ncbi:MAG: two-component regulator propeller domain-containing protein [Chryseolinea sp.]
MNGKFAAKRLIALLLLFPPLLLFGQEDIAIGTWRLHPSYNNISHVALQGTKRVFAAAAHGIMVVNREDNSIETYTRLNGLQGSAITSIAFHESTSSLLIAYGDGKFDVLDSENNVVSFDPAANTMLNGSRRINSIAINKENALLAADYGVVVFDVGRKQIKETWRDLGVTGEPLKIIQSASRDDSIFLATSNGVIAGSQSANLQDFSNWKRFNANNFNTEISSITVFDGYVFAAINNDGIYRLENGRWVLQNFLQGGTFVSLNSSDNSLIVVQPDDLWLISQNILAGIADPLIVRPGFAVIDGQGKLWIGDGVNGLLSDMTGTIASFLPNSPANEETTNISYQRGKIFNLSGGFDQTGAPLRRLGSIDIFEDGSWSTKQTAMFDVTDVAAGSSDNETYISSFGYGVEMHQSDGTTTIFDESNSPLINVNPPGRFVNITAMNSTAHGLWVANYGANKPLHLLKADHTWESFSFQTNASRFPIEMVADFNGSIWMILDPGHGGGIIVFNKDKNGIAYLTDEAGRGGLPSRNIWSIEIDRDGIVWVGTDLGACYFINPAGIFDGPADAIKPIIDGRFLLRDDKVTAIAVDGGNRKWFGTERGVWLYGPGGDEALENKTAANSPLPSDVIVDIAISDRSGEVFFATAEGLASYRAGATKEDVSFHSVKVFPNPVLSTFVGTVGISGTPADAIIKITDISGKLVWETRASGGTATWNVQDNKGRRVPTGIYIVFTVSPDGNEKVASKIAVVD